MRIVPILVVLLCYSCGAFKFPTTKRVTTSVVTTTTTTESTTTATQTTPTTPFAAITPGSTNNATIDFSSDSAKTRQCECDEVEECRATAFNNVDSCFDQCHHALEVLGKNTQNFIECFSDKNIRGFTQAEVCLREEIGEICNSGNDTVYIPTPNYDDYTGFHYRNRTTIPAALPLHMKAHKTFHVFQRFYHCAKHCIHRGVLNCVIAKKCAVALPQPDSFAQSMEKCVKHHPGATKNLWDTCRCLITKKKLTQLTGQCAVFITDYYMKKL